MPSRGASLAALGLGLALAFGAGAQTMYKWTTEDGKVQYSDKPPKNFKGVVTRIEADAAPPPVIAPRKSAPPVVDEEKAAAEPAGDIAAKRRATRERLAANVERARAQLADAKKKRAEGDDPGEDERQTVQRVRDADLTTKATPRLNCREVTPPGGGKKTVFCGAVVPNEAYYERIERLDEAVRRAEAELAAAEQDYRRGVD